MTEPQTLQGPPYFRHSGLQRSTQQGFLVSCSPSHDCGTSGEDSQLPHGPPLGPSGLSVFSCWQRVRHVGKESTAKGLHPAQRSCWRLDVSLRPVSSDANPDHLAQVLSAGSTVSTFYCFPLWLMCWERHSETLQIFFLLKLSATYFSTHQWILCATITVVFAERRFFYFPPSFYIY